MMDDGRRKAFRLRYQVFSTLRKETAEGGTCPVARLTGSHLCQDNPFRYIVRNALQHKWEHTELQCCALEGPFKLIAGRSTASALLRSLTPTHLLLWWLH